jgi:hypothetical protein
MRARLQRLAKEESTTGKLVVSFASSGSNFWYEAVYTVYVHLLRIWGNSYTRLHLLGLLGIRTLKC